MTLGQTIWRAADGVVWAFMGYKVLLRGQSL
jgi:hypothetical protein